VDEETPRRFARLRPTTPLGVLSLGCLLVVLLGLVAAASRVHDAPGSSGGIKEPPSGVGDYVFSIVAVLVVAGALFMLYLWVSERDMLAEQRRRQQSKGAYKAIVILMILALVAAIIAHYHLSFGGALAKLGQRPHRPSNAQALKKKAQEKGQPTPPQFQWLPVLVATGAGMVLLGFIGARTMKRSRNELEAKFALEQEFAKVIDDTLDDLHREKDPRKAIIAAYARMERLFETYGVPRHQAEAPMEYLGRALHELRASGAALGRLTGLFQWAKFSSHEVDETMRADAIAALTQVRDELRANRQEDELRRADSEALRAQRESRGEASADDDRTFGENPFDAAHEKMKGNIYTQR
jgi:hypothetical protein